MESFPRCESSPKLSYTCLLHIYVVYTHTLYTYTTLLHIIVVYFLYTCCIHIHIFLVYVSYTVQKMSERDIIDSLSKLSLRFAEGFLFSWVRQIVVRYNFLVWLHSLTFRYMFVLLCINTRFSIELPEAEPSKAPLRIMQLCGKPKVLRRGPLRTPSESYNSKQ